MKGGSMAGTFFRFLAGQNEKDKLDLQELKELDAYKDERRHKQAIEAHQSSQNDADAMREEEDNELALYKENNNIIDGISEENEYDTLKGGSMKGAMRGSMKGGGLLIDSNVTDNNNFNSWFNSSSEAHSKLVKKEDPLQDQTAVWERQKVGDLSFHIDKNSI